MSQWSFFYYELDPCEQNLNQKMIKNETIFSEEN